jgi:uncharacterized membrane protein
MSRKWLERESPMWVDKGLISKEQAENIKQLYPERKYAAGMLPILGAILVGLGVLSFVAANWQDIPHLARFAMILITMVGFYAGGEAVLRKGGNRHLGISLIAAGLFSFGAGIILVGQMFHMVADDAATFMIWGTAGALLSFIYRHNLLAYLTLAIYSAGQVYSMTEFNTFSLTAYVLTILVMGAYWRWSGSDRIAWFSAASVMIQSVMWIGSEHWREAWFLIPIIAMYTLGEFLKGKAGSPLQQSALSSAFILGTLVVLFPNEFIVHWGRGWEPIFYSIYGVIAAALFLISIFAKWREGRLKEAFDWMIMVPFFFIPDGADLLYLLALCFYSLYLLWRGYDRHWRFQINLGTGLFLFSVLLAYTKLAWGFMDKSIFFLTGGIILLTLSWYLNRKKREALGTEKGGDPNGK